MVLSPGSTDNNGDEVYKYTQSFMIAGKGFGSGICRRTIILFSAGVLGGNVHGIDLKDMGYYPKLPSACCWLRATASGSGSPEAALGF